MNSKEPINSTGVIGIIHKLTVPRIGKADFLDIWTRSTTRVKQHILWTIGAFLPREIGVILYEFWPDWKSDFEIRNVKGSSKAAQKLYEEIKDNWDHREDLFSEDFFPPEIIQAEFQRAMACRKYNDRMEILASRADAPNELVNHVFKLFLSQPEDATTWRADQFVEGGMSNLTPERRAIVYDSGAAATNSTVAESLLARGDVPAFVLLQMSQSSRLNEGLKNKATALMDVHSGDGKQSLKNLYAERRKLRADKTELKKKIDELAKIAHTGHSPQKVTDEYYRLKGQLWNEVPRAIRGITDRINSLRKGLEAQKK